MTSCRCRRNVYMLAVAFLCNFASYMTLESMQSSLNRGIGTTALCLLYASLVVSSIFLPPLAIAKLDCRKSLTLSILSFATYTLANFYPVSYTLIPAAVILGMGSSVMWSCAFYYVMQLSQKHAMEKKQCTEKVTSEFFGKFSSISHFSILVGTLFMSAVFESVGISDSYTEDASAVTDTLLTENNSLISSTTPWHVNTSTVSQSTILSPNTQSQCGLYYKFADVEVEKEKSVSDVVMYVLLSSFLLFNLIAACLCLCLDEIKGTETAFVEEAVCASMASLNSNKIEVYGVKDNKQDSEETIPLPEKQDPENLNLKEDMSIFKLFKSTSRILMTDKAALLLIPFTLHYGIMQGFVRGVYNASWITCALGIKYVAYVTCMYAAVMITLCFSFGKLLRYISHVKLFACTMSLEVGVLTFLLFWEPNPDKLGDVVLLFVVPFLLGISHSSLSSQIGSLYSKFFPDNKKSGSSLQGIWNPLGSAIAYGLSGPLFPVHMIILVMSACVVGALLYIVAEWIKEKPYRKCPKNSCF